ncbi:hypothetical protein ACWCOP_08925 [Maricaulaceae bacterium MS644]
MSKPAKLLTLIVGAMVIVVLAYTGGKALGSGMAEREIAAAEQGQS